MVVADGRHTSSAQELQSGDGADAFDEIQQTGNTMVVAVVPHFHDETEQNHGHLDVHGVYGNLFGFHQLEGHQHIVQLFLRGRRTHDRLRVRQSALADVAGLLQRPDQTLLSHLRAPDKQEKPKDIHVRSDRVDPEEEHEGVRGGLRPFGRRYADIRDRNVRQGPGRHCVVQRFSPGRGREPGPVTVIGSGQCSERTRS